ncbi:MAG: hypothetical protein QOE70_1292 [Chthoniobacter sp.]|jgi:hypothetical protein|nr:hypothetical protein [Chthoniobacter sp.]
MSKQGTIAIAGSLAQRPGHGGHTWVFLQYLLGFKRLGYDVLFLDWLDASMCFDEKGQPCAVEDSINLRYFTRVMKEFGLEGAYALNFNQGERMIGMSRRTVLARARSAGFLLNVMGFFSDYEILAAFPKRVFLDIDPGFGQMWQQLGLATVFGGHDAYVTIGENIGQADCTVPTCALSWITTPQPIVLEKWPVHEGPAGDWITSIASWRGPFGPIDYRGKIYGLRVHEFRKFAALPKFSGAQFRLALDIHSAETNDLSLLAANDWELIDPRDAAGDPQRYQQYIRRSKAEFMVAKNLYVETKGGWFSDRSICYLATGKPVLAQDTGFTRRYPVGEGLLAFSTLDEALGGIAEISSNYAQHARAARQIAEEYFDSDRVLRRLLGALGVA